MISQGPNKMLEFEAFESFLYWQIKWENLKILFSCEGNFEEQER